MPEPAPPARLQHQPAFDGLRGLAVTAVLLFHADFSWARGGFLGVSTFFTLSGFLITSLLVSEWDVDGRISLGRFFSRRVRRLLPASILTLVLVVVYARFGAGPSELASIRHDVLAAAAQVSNWWFIHDGRSYGALFRAPSMVEHYWSLAIEEQFYLVFPPLLVLALRKGWSLRRIATGVLVGIALSIAVTFVIGSGTGSADRIYFGTDTRALELLVGVLLALATVRRRELSDGVRDLIVAAGTAGLVISVGVWGMVSIGNQWLFHGGLWVYALASGAVVLACREPGPVQSLLSFRPLRALGAISYGVYLLHWPIYRILTPDRLHTSLVGAFVMRVLVTLAAASVSAIAVELPIRRGRVPRTASRWAPPSAAFGALAAIVFAAFVVVPSGNVGFDINKANERYNQDLKDQTPAIAGAPRVAVFGDSTAVSLSIGLASWSKRTHFLTLVDGSAELGCGIILTGEVRYGTGVTRESSRCRDRDLSYPELTKHMNVALVMFGPWDVADHRLEGDNHWRHIGDPVYDAALRVAAEHLVSLLTKRGALVVWVLSPLILEGTVDGHPPTRRDSTSDPARMRRLNRMIRAIAESHPTTMRTINLPAYLRTQPGGELDPHLRPDGVHFTDDSSAYVSTQWFGPELLKVIGSARR